MNRSALASHAALLLVYASGLYLLLFDKLLRQFGYFHWIILLAYLIVMAVTLAIRYVTRKKALTALVGIFALLMFIAQIADAALNLPISGFKGTNGFAYLFGFGTTPLSSFGTSTAFTIFLIFNIVLAALCFAQYRKK
ncbi:hypothetical protein Micr_00114 [Candidatus Micrarchaeum sp.]|jgi:hypothetical protein|uniref:hypothetical protein n=1 Tax=Candidatus Micrarchaeum sp. TaxID=2282148 RepID=UPI00092C1817|nr:hypothetical protein [Candidatus Micrarchaeum sp.]OJI06977.1 MAG: hypothetical protein BK997_03900 [Candidatus Micrarchaeum sp. ARMAN-1]OWP54014.1 MAG: hypothetical protein B2I19_00695 [Thermoplasmatales archaeon ARMAN]QRF73600.1 hypothetical protein Micr_00114 [Candidatus Micrarchaeum sp.]